MPTFSWAEAVAGDRTAAAQASRAGRNADRNADLTMDTRTPLSGYSSSPSRDGAKLQAKARRRPLFEHFRENTPGTAAGRLDIEDCRQSGRDVIGRDVRIVAPRFDARTKEQHGHVGVVIK